MTGPSKLFRVNKSMISYVQCSNGLIILLQSQERETRETCVEDAVQEQLQSNIQVLDEPDELCRVFAINPTY